MSFKKCINIGQNKNRVKIVKSEYRRSHSDLLNVYGEKLQQNVRNKHRGFVQVYKFVSIVI